MTGLYDLWLCSFRIGVPEAMIKAMMKVNDYYDEADFDGDLPSNHLKMIKAMMKVNDYDDDDDDFDSDSPQ